MKKADLEVDKAVLLDRLLEMRDQIDITLALLGIDDSTEDEEDEDE